MISFLKIPPDLFKAPIPGHNHIHAGIRKDITGAFSFESFGRIDSIYAHFKEPLADFDPFTLLLPSKRIAVVCLRKKGAVKFPDRNKIKVRSISKVLGKAP